MHLLYVGCHLQHPKCCKMARLWRGWHRNVDETIFNQNVAQC